ncbi:MAG: AAA family ATPase [Clostridia bacterium]|nr:AAA family ATPase [Clostridia bacterium]
MYPKEFEGVLKCLPKPPDFSFDFEGLFETELKSILMDMQKTPQNPAWHAEGDCWTHTKMVCMELCGLSEFQNLPDEERNVLALAALLHDAGKPFTTREEMGELVSPGHALKGANLVRALLWREMGLSGEKGYQLLRESVCLLIRYHTQPAHILENNDPMRRARKIASNGCPAKYFTLKNLCLLAEADERGRINPEKEQRILNVELARAAMIESGAYTSPYPFRSDVARYAYLSGKKVWEDQELFDDTWGEIILLCGLPGTGKDTYIRMNFPSLPVVSLDDVRREMGVKPGDNQGAVIQAAHERAREFLRKKQPFIWNATSLLPSLRRTQVSLFEDYGASVKILFLETGWKENIERDKERKFAVSEKVISDMLNKFVPPEAFEARRVEWIIV